MLMEFMTLSLSGIIRVLKFGVIGSGTVGSGCWLFKNLSNVLARGNWKNVWSGPL